MICGIISKKVQKLQIWLAIDKILRKVLGIQIVGEF
jgi:hypothetical protein